MAKGLWMTPPFNSDSTELVELRRWEVPGRAKAAPRDGAGNDKKSRLAARRSIPENRPQVTSG